MRRSRAGAVAAVSGAALAGAVLAGTGGLGHAAPVAGAATTGTAAASVAGGSGQERTDQEGITITATGQASGTPDELRVSLAAEVTRPRADAALTASSGVAARVAAALKAAGVAARDVRTSDLNVSADYDSNDHVTGWTARTSLDATLHDLARAGTVLDAAIAAGGTSLRVDGLSYDLADPDAVLAKARAQAFQRAQERARAYAAAAGRPLGRVVHVVEAGSDGVVEPASGTLRVPAASASAGSFDPGALQPGSTDVSVTSTVRWSFA